MKKFVNYKYVLDELLSSMKDAIQNAQSVVDRTTELVELISTYQKDGEFDDFIKMFNEQTDNYKQQIKIMQYRVDIVESILPELSENDYLWIVSELLEALGVANKDAKSVEEREENNEEVIVC